MARKNTWNQLIGGDSFLQEPWLPSSMSSLAIPMAGNEDEFKQRARLIAYQQLLYRMFGSSFECTPVSGGFSGSSVVKITPFGALGNREESVIVKLDSAHNVRTEVAHSMQARAALGDVAARVLGEPIYITSDIDGQEYGGFKVELAGAVLQVPELSARGAESPMINTFKDLVVYECEEAILSRITKSIDTIELRIEDDGFNNTSLSSGPGVSRPYGSVFTIVKELFGLDGSATRSLRRFEAGSGSSVRRRISFSDPNHPSGGDFLVSRLPAGEIKESEATSLVLQMIRNSADSATFSNTSPYDQVNHALEQARSALARAPKDWRLVRGFSHGDLNGSNIIIDAMEGMWLIDFATAKKLPLTADLAKLETCILFEYSFIPIPVDLLISIMDSGSIEPTLVATWLRVPVDALDSFLSFLPPNTKLVTEVQIDSALAKMTDQQSARRLRARLVADPSVFWASVYSTVNRILPGLLPSCPNTIPPNVFRGVIDMAANRRELAPMLPPPLLAMGMALQATEKMRQYCLSDIEKLFRTIDSDEESGGIFNWDVSPIEYSVMLLRESARLVRYTDVPPWTKLVVGHFAASLGCLVESEVDRLLLQDAGLIRVELPPSPLMVEISRNSTPVDDSDSEDLSDSNEGAIQHSVSVFRGSDEEAKKYLKYVKAKYGYLIDFVSGRQLDVVSQCCELRLFTATESSINLDYLTHGGPIQPAAAKAMLVSGIPGSGKSFLLRKLLVDSIQNSGVIPIFVPVNDWLKIISNSTSSICALNEFIHSQFVDDDARCRLLRSCVKRRQCLLLVDGLDDAGDGLSLKRLVDCLLSKASNGIRIVVTYRKNCRSEWAIEALSKAGFGLAEIAPLDRDQRRQVVKSRLSDATVVAKFEAFFDSITEVSNELLKSPAFLSMLLCYWSNLQVSQAELSPPPLVRQTTSLVRSTTEAAASVDFARAVSPTSGNIGTSSPSVIDVYRVAVSVLIHRYQVLQEADRSRVRESARRVNDLLRLVAFHMKLDQTDAIISSVVARALTNEAQNELWLKVSEHVIQGRFSLLTHSAASGDFRFCLSGILDLLAAEHLIHSDDVTSICSLVTLETLVSDPWWIPTLAILAEKAPVKYVRLIERKLTTTGSQVLSDTCVHLAARAGHLPFFKVLSRSSLLESLVERPNSVSLLPIHEAAKSQTGAAAEICKLLVAARADVWATTADGWCALHYAASFHNREVCAALLEDSRSSEGGSFNQLPQLPRRQLVRLSESGLDLATKIIKNELKSSEDFIEKAKHVFPELSYFRGRSDTTPDASASVVGLDPSEIEYRRTIGAMLSVFWVVSDRYEDFTQGQPPHCKLSYESWERIRSWMGKHLKSPESVDAMLCLMAIHDLGKLKDFRNDLAKDYKDHDAAMRFIMSTTPEVLPSLCRLPETFQQIVKSALGLDFNFGQFLQGENLPANLCAIKDLIATQGEETLAFYLFHIFADMAGIMGAATLQGSAFMTETMYSNFALGIEALSALSSKPFVEDVYDDFLRKRSVGQQLKWERELIRLACLSRVFDPSGAAMVRLAWESLETDSRNRLQDHLARSGLRGKRPAFLLYYAPAFMENAKRNSCIGLKEAMKFLLRIYEAAEHEFKSSSNKSVVVIHIAEAAELAKRSTPVYLESVCFRIIRSTGSRRLSEATVRISPWLRPSRKSDEPVMSGDNEEVPELKFGKGNVCIAAQLLTHIYENDYKNFSSRFPAIGPSAFNSLNEWVKQSHPKLVYITVALSWLTKDTLDQIRKDLGLNEDVSVGQIAERYPSVFPSFQRLSAEERIQVVSVLSFPFLLESVVNGERLRFEDANFLLNRFNRDTTRLYLIHSLVCSSKSVWCEGYLSVFIHTANRLLGGGSSGSEFVQDILEFRGEYLLPISSPRNGVAMMMNGEREALIRLCCLVNAYFQTGGSVVQSAFNSSLSQTQKSELISFLSTQSSQVMTGLSRFLSACKLNSAVGLESGISLLLRILRRMSLLTDSVLCDLTLIAERAVSHSTSVCFADIAFVIRKNGVICPEVLIPVNERSKVLSLLAANASTLTSQLVSGISTSEMIENLDTVYPEISAFSLMVEKGYAPDVLSPDRTVASAPAATVERDRTIRSIQSIIFVLTNGYESFTRNQSKPILTITSWMQLCDWLAGSVLANPDTVDALFTLIIVSGVSKLTGINIESNQSLFPSLLRLSLKHKSLVLGCVRSGFNFGQFLQGESGPESLTNVISFVRGHGSFGLDFLLAANFALQSGLSDPIFMNDSRWRIFKMGKDAIGQRPDRESPEAIYSKYLIRRGGSVLSGFREDMTEFRALCRLICLARITNENEARSMEVAFDDLSTSDKMLLAKNLSSPNGPAVLQYLPSLLENLRHNSSVPVHARLVILNDLVKVAVSCGRKIVDLSLAANWAREVQMFDYNSSDFKFTSSDTAGVSRINVLSHREFT
jgi:hypothetical protein